MKRLRIGLWIGIPLVVAATILLASGVPQDRLKTVIEQELGEALGLPVHIDGAVRLGLVPWVRLQVAALRVDNFPERASPSLLTIDELALELRILPLLRDRFIIEALEVEGAELRIEPDAEGRWPLQLDLDTSDPESAEDDALALLLRGLAARNLRIVFDPFGEAPSRELTVRELLAGADDHRNPLGLEMDGIFEGEAFHIEATLGSPAELSSLDKPFPVDLAARFALGTLDVKGNLGGPGLALRFDAELVDPSARARELGFELPPVGAFSIKGDLTRRDTTLGVQALSIRSRGDGPLDLVVDGSIRDLVRAEGVDLDVRLSAPDLHIFAPLSPVALPEVPVHAHLQIDDADGSLGIEGNAGASRKGTLELDASGVFDDLRRASELDVHIDLQALDLDKLAELLHLERFELPALGPLEVAGQLVMDAGKLALHEIDLQLGDPEAIWAQASGTIGDLLALREVAVEARFGAASARRLAAIFERDIPEVGSVTAALSLRDDDGSLGIEHASLEVGQPGAFELKVTSAFDDLRDLDEIHVDAQLTARDLGVLAALLDARLPAIAPVNFTGQARGSADALRASGRLQLGSAHFEGEFRGSATPGARPSIDLRLHSPLVHLPEFVTPTAGPRQRQTRTRERDFDIAAWWRGEQALPADPLPALDAELRLEVARITGYELLDVEGLVLSARLTNGHLVIDPVAANYESGRVAGRLEVDTRGVAPEATVQLESFNVDLTKLLSQFRTKTGKAGSLDASLDLRSHGTSARELRSNVSGNFGAMLRKGTLLRGYARAFTFDVLRVSIPDFLPSLETNPEASAPVQCLLAIVPIENGIAQMETLYLEGPEITILGEGQVDLGKERFDLVLTPYPHDPALVSMAATVEVEGPLTSPVFRPLRTSMVVSAVQALWRNALRPARSVDRVLRRLARLPDDERPDPCGQVAVQRVRQMQTGVVEPIDLEVLLGEGSG